MLIVIRCHKLVPLGCLEPCRDLSWIDFGYIKISDGLLPILVEQNKKVSGCIIIITSFQWNMDQDHLKIRCAMLMVNLLSSHSGPCDRHRTICVSHQVMLFDRLECPLNKLAVGAEIRLRRETQAFYLRTAGWEMCQIKGFFYVQVCYHLTKLGMLNSDVGVFVNLIYVLCN